MAETSRSEASVLPHTGTTRYIAVAYLYIAVNHVACVAVAKCIDHLGDIVGGSGLGKVRLFAELLVEFALTRVLEH